MSPLNDTSLTSFMLVILLELLIQSNHHLLSKGTPCQNQQSSIMKIRQSGCLRRFWIHNIQNWVVTFSTKFINLIAILILFNITQTVINFKTHLKLYMNIICNISTNQVCSLLNWSWFAISQQRQAEKKSRIWFQRSSQTHYSSLTGFSFGKMVSKLWEWSSHSKWGVMLGAVPCWSGAYLVKIISQQLSSQSS